jgi:hypothetical protein
MPARKSQNQAKPFASARFTGSTISPRDVNPVNATVQHTIANRTDKRVASLAEIFMAILDAVLRNVLSSVLRHQALSVV